MVQLEPNLQLVLKHLAPAGAVLPAESTVSAKGLYDHSRWTYRTATNSQHPGVVQAALDHSLPIKRREAGLQTLVLWGRLLARNGKVCPSATRSRPDAWLDGAMLYAAY